MQIEPTGTVATTQTSYMWEIEDVEKHWDCKPGEAIVSPNFITQTSNSRQKLWKMFLFFHGDSEKNKSYVSLYAQSESNICEEKQLRLSILDKEMKKIYGIMFYETLSTSKDRIRWGSSRFIHGHIFSNMFSQLQLTNLTILCEVVVNYVGTQSVLQYQEKKLHTDIGALLENGIFSDLTIVVEGENISTHKNILAARSTTFAQWFKDGTIGSDNHSLQITDVKLKIFTKLLQFIYTEKTDFQVNEALELLQGASKYGLIELQFMCEEMLSENLNLVDAVKNLIIADKYHARHLKECTMNFIISNAREILDTPNYKIMAEKYPKLLREIYEQTVLRA